jgi:hypothetical protein
MATHRKLWVAGAAMTALVSATPALAESALEGTQEFETLGQVLTVEGDAHCDRFAPGSEIIELEESGPAPDFTLTGPRRQKITAAIPDGASLHWQATVPVNFVIVRGTERGLERRKDKRSGLRDPATKTYEGSRAISHVYVFGDDGTLFDRGETAPNVSAIQQVRYCYGLSEEPEPLPMCAEIENGPQCPVDEEQVERNGALVFFDFDEIDFGGAKECVCGTTVLVECNEKAPAGEEDTCAGGELSALPVEYLAIKNPDSTICRTIDGKRKCRKKRRR